MVQFFFGGGPTFWGGSPFLFLGLIDSNLTVTVTISVTVTVSAPLSRPVEKNATICNGWEILCLPSAEFLGHFLTIMVDFCWL